MKKQNQGKQIADNELSSRLLFLFIVIIVYRIGTFITIPGINIEQIESTLFNENAGILQLGNLFSGGAIARMSVFSLNLMPYISASIVIQLLSHMPGKLKEIRKSGTQGRKKITQYTRYLAVAVAFFQGLALCLSFQNGYALYTGPAFWLVGALTLTVGALFLMWLGEQITDKGIGNGVSVLICVGICASLPSVLGGLISGAKNGDVSVIFALTIMLLLMGLFFFIVYMELTQRRISVHYARQQMGAYNARPTYLPLKINLAGVMPAIFSSAILIFITMFLKFLSDIDWFSSMFDGKVANILNKLQPMITTGQPVYIILYGLLVIAFAFFYTGLVFENKELSEDLKRSGAFIQGIRPGKATADYLDLVQNRLTLVGAIYVAFVVLLPEVFNMNSSNQVLTMFGGTSLLIIVVVAMDFIQQFESLRQAKTYQSLMKRSRIGQKRV